MAKVEHSRGYRKLRGQKEWLLDEGRHVMELKRRCVSTFVTVFIASEVSRLSYGDYLVENEIAE